ncbi:ABC transporter permease [Bacillus sp. B1-b2]|uniref:ABC transporter permease n=1 Tax=Bacillus sp. B1-b2 TaxID=2653201 RepID=UPI0012620D34|nr:ABC transporter permease [Bacillus sp. B1-b2]KAB7665399.1 ABC transporter permease [Bacillus sp. B1-b2]
MLRQLIIKELLMLWRRPRELIVLLLMPFILITILGSALGALDGGDVSIHPKLAVVVKDQEMMGQQKAIEEVTKSTLSAEEIEGRIQVIQSVNPISIFLDQVVKDPELEKILSVKVFERDVTENEDKKYDGVLVIPSGFSEAFYHHLFNQSTTIPSWHLTVQEKGSINASVIEDILASYQKEWSYMKTAQDLQIDDTMLADNHHSMKIESITKKKEIGAFSYYAIGMCVMFMFYVATTIAGLAYQQKEEGIYERIILANVSPVYFFAAIFIAAFLFSFIQLHLLFGLSALIYGVIFSHFVPYFIITLLLNMMAAALATFVTLLSFRFNSRNVENMISNLVIPVLAFIGGSFINLSSLGGVMEKLGEYSPAGAAITAYLKVYQGYELTEIGSQILAMLVFIILLLLLSLTLVKRRGDV